MLECRLAAMLLASQLPSADWRQVSVLKQVEPPLLQLGAAQGLGAAHEQLPAAVRQLLPQQGYQLDEVSVVCSALPVCGAPAITPMCVCRLHDRTLAAGGSSSGRAPAAGA